MSKFIKWLSITLGALIVLLLIGMIALPIIFPLEKIKAYAIDRISEAIHRDVKIEKVSFNIFSGISLQKLYVGNRQGFSAKPFIAAEAIELHYAFWPLFSRQIIINEFELVRPEILIEKNRAGEYNFSDLMQSKKQGPVDPPQSVEKKETKLPFSLFVNKFSLSQGKLTYVDQTSGSTNTLSAINISIAGLALSLIKPIDVRASAVVNYQGKAIPLSFGGSVIPDLEKEALNIPDLSFSIASEKAGGSLSLINIRKAPHLDFNLNSKRLSLDPFVALFAAPAGRPKATPKKGALTRSINQLTSSLPRNVSVNGNLNIENLSFQQFKVDRAALSLALSNKNVSVAIKQINFYEGTLSGNAAINLSAPGLAYSANDLKLSGFNAHPFSNAVIETFLTSLPDYHDLLDKVYGTLNLTLSLRGQGVETPEIMTNAQVVGTFKLKNGELKKLRSVAAIADRINSPSLKQDLKITEVSGGLSYKDRILNIKNLNLIDHDVRLTFGGGLDLAKQKYLEGNRLTLRASPTLTQGLPPELNLFRDKNGWFELTFELKGELKKPLPTPILEKPLEAIVGKFKVKIEAKKVELEQKASEEAKKLEAQAKQKAEEEKKRLEEEAKKKLKELIKY